MSRIGTPGVVSMWLRHESQTTRMPMGWVLMRTASLVAARRRGCGRGGRRWRRGWRASRLLLEPLRRALGIALNEHEQVLVDAGELACRAERALGTDSRRPYRIEQNSVVVE